MKRFTWTLIVLILVSGIVFMVGWLPLRVQPGSYAVLASKTGGIDPHVIEPGRFFWSTAALLPTNIRLSSFLPLHVERSFSLTGELPSAAAYRAFMAGEPDFTWELTIRMNAAPLPSALPALVSRFGVKDDEALAAWLVGEMDAAVSDARALAVDLLGDLEGASKLSSGAADEDLRKAIALKRPLLDVISVSVVSARVPDFSLYSSARSMYLSYMERFRESIEPALTQASNKAVEDQVRLDVLARYGELLERFPGLVDYLAIEAGLPPRPWVDSSGTAGR